MREKKRKKKKNDAEKAAEEAADASLRRQVTGRMRFNAGEQYLEKISHEVDNLLEMKKQMENPDIEEIDKPVFTLSIMDRIKNLLENPSNLPQYSAMAAWQQLEEELETGEIEGTLGEPYPPNFQITSAVQLFEQLTLHPDQC